MIASSSSCPSRSERGLDPSGGVPPRGVDPAVAVIACGALAAAVRSVVGARGWAVEVHPLSALMHDRPERIAPRVAGLAGRLQAAGKRVVVAYADCGTYGALDEVCTRMGLTRLPGLHCYDLLAGEQQVRALLAEEPGTYLLTDFLAASFARTVVAELGLDRHPELAADYFRHYRRVVWLCESPTPELAAAAGAAAAVMGLPLETVVVGRARLDAALERLLAGGG